MSGRDWQANGPMTRLGYRSSHISNPDKFFSLYRFSPRVVDPGLLDAAGAPPVNDIDSGVTSIRSPAIASLVEAGIDDVRITRQ